MEKKACSSEETHQSTKMTENMAYLGMCTQCRQANAKEGEGEKASKTQGGNQFTKTLEKVMYFVLKATGTNERF